MKNKIPTMHIELGSQKRLHNAEVTNDSTWLSYYDLPVIGLLRLCSTMSSSQAPVPSQGDGCFWDTGEGSIKKNDWKMKVVLFINCYNLKTGRFQLCHKAWHLLTRRAEIWLETIGKTKSFTRRSCLKHKAKQNVPCFEQLTEILKRWLFWWWWEHFLFISIFYRILNYTSLGSRTVLGSKRSSIWIIKTSILFIGIQIFRISNYWDIWIMVVYYKLHKSWYCNNSTGEKRVVSIVG